MSCESCKKKGLSKINWMMVVSFEIFIVSIYGHIELIKNLKDIISFLF
jgi:hypothetical protein